MYICIYVYISLYINIYNPVQKSFDIYVNFWYVKHKIIQETLKLTLEQQILPRYKVRYLIKKIFMTIFGKDNCYVLLSIYYIPGTSIDLLYNDLIESLQHDEVNIIVIPTLQCKSMCLLKSHV